jgi:NTP pyrophosphatase (non-canonical NTP hydrolase)
MEYSHANVGQTPLDEYVSIVAKIYSQHDKHRSIWDVWCHTLHHAAGVAEQIRKRAPDEDLHREIADFSLWLFTMVLKLKGEFGRSEGSFEAPHDRFIRIQSTCSDLLWHKYPKSCPSCSSTRIADTRTDDVRPGHINPCGCPLRSLEAEGAVAKSKRIEALRNYSIIIRAEKPKAIDEWQKMFGMVFETNLKVLALSEIALRLMEKLGEVSDAMIRMYTYSEKKFDNGEPNRRQSNLEGEIADVFSWLFALVERLDSLSQKTHENTKLGPEVTTAHTPSVRLSGIIWDRYGSDALESFCCWKCKARECRCQIILVPATRPAEEVLQKFQ